MLNRFLRILSAYYWMAYVIHHGLFLRPGRGLGHSRLMVVGSFRAGGAGKTPFCLWLARRLTAQGKRVAVLCHKIAFDEIRLYQEELKDEIQKGLASVVATSNRYRSSLAIDQGENAPDFILCDDGFEDSRLRPHAIFRLDWEKAPTDIEELIPHGKFRSLLQDHARDLQRTIPIRCYGVNPDVQFYIDSIANCNGEFPQHGQNIALCGLGDPERFFNDLRRAELTLSKAIARPDHDRLFEKNARAILLDSPKSNLIISQKDATRISQGLQKDPRIFIARQSIRVFDRARLQIQEVLLK